MFIIFSMFFMLFAIVKTKKAIKKLPQSNKSFAMSNRSIFGVYNTGCSLDEREIYSLTNEELGF